MQLLSSVKLKLSINYLSIVRIFAILSNFFQQTKFHNILIYVIQIEDSLTLYISIYIL